MAKLPQVFAFIDTETTGLSPSRDRVIEIGIIRVENGEIVGELNSVVRPNMFVPPEIFALTGISDNEIQLAPEFTEIGSRVRELLDGAIFTAHNARFDYAFLKHEFTRMGNPYQSRVLCTVRLTRRLFPKVSHYSLSHLIDYFGIKPSARHRAYADAEVLHEIYKIALSHHGEARVNEVVNSILATSSLPSNLKPSQVENLPDSPGIYMFFGQDSKLPLYVGKSVNIKERVKSHFSGDHRIAVDLTMSSQIARVESVATAGEIGALIREAEAVKALMPIYNKQLRRRHDLWVAIRAKKGNYSSVELFTAESAKLEPDNILAVYKSKKMASEALHSLCREYHLCPKLLGIEKAKGACFMSQIGICPGACTGDADSDEYNSRFEEAFSKTKVKQWPYAGAIAITEQNHDGMVETHVVDQWVYFGSAVYKYDDMAEIKKEKYTPRFDWDIYKILAKSVLNPKKIRVLTKAQVEEFLN